MSNSYLPKDLLFLFLIRLPLKTIVRFKCVSKSWNALISSSEFIRFHLQYLSSIQNNPIRLLCVDDIAEFDHSKNWFIYSGHKTHSAEYLIHGRDSENLEIGCEIQPIYNPYEIHAPEMRSMFVGYCNGLLCQMLRRDQSLGGDSSEYEISLCNPLTKSSWVLPKSPLFLEDGIGSTRGIAFYGFGYDDVHDTYKVLLVSGPPREYEYEVFSLRPNNWVLLRSDLDLHDYDVDCEYSNLEGVGINGALHWIIRNNAIGPDHQNKKKKYILSFDLRVDQLNISQIPEAAEEYSVLLLSVLNGCLLLTGGRTHTIESDPEATFDMWMMKDYGLKEESWTRIRIRDSPYNLWRLLPVALIEDNNNDHHHRNLIYHDHERFVSGGMTLLNYDMESHQVGEFRLPPSEVRFPIPKQVQFVGSLVQPHPPSETKEDNGSYM